MKDLFLVSIVMIGLFSCTKNVQENSKSKACFDFDSQKTYFIGDSVVFSNCSQNAISYAWNFGDGLFSNENNPKHSFKKSGTYKIILLAQNEVLKDINGDGMINWYDGTLTKDTISKTIIVVDKSKVCFDFNPQVSIKEGDSITFSNCSDMFNNYYWDFGDGQFSNFKNPKHSFKSAGVYNVKLRGVNLNYSDSIAKSITINKKGTVVIPFKNSISKKWLISNKLKSSYSSDYIWFEFFLDNTYIISKSDNTYLSGKYLISDDMKTITLISYGVMTINNLSENEFAFTIKLNNSTSAVSLSTTPAPQINISTKTDLLCRNWDMYMSLDIYPTKTDTTLFPNNDIKKLQVVFSKYGTYFVTRVDTKSTEFYNSKWKWKDQSESIRPSKYIFQKNQPLSIFEKN